MGASVAELIVDRIGAMPASERRAAQTLGRQLPADRPEDGRRFFAAGRRQRRPPSCASSPGSASRTTRNSSWRCRTSSPRSCSRRCRAATKPAVPRAGDESRRWCRRSSRTSARRSGTSRTSRSVDIAAQLADRRSKTFLVGGRFTDPIARYMAAHLTIIRPNVFHLDRTGEQLARPADRHGQARRAGHLRHQALPGEPGPLCREGASARRPDRAVHRPVAVADRPFRAPCDRRPHRGAVAWNSSAALFVVAEALIGELTRQLELHQRSTAARDRPAALNLGLTDQVGAWRRRACEKSAPRRPISRRTSLRR